MPTYIIRDATQDDVSRLRDLIPKYPTSSALGDKVRIYLVCSKEGLFRYWSILPAAKRQNTAYEYISMDEALNIVPVALFLATLSK